jgi:predicted nucleic acid-binding protein
MLFIYWLENSPQYAKRVGAIRTRMEERGDRLITGAFTFGEVLAGPYRVANSKVADEIKHLLQDAVSEVVSFTDETADHYARIRGTLRVPPADAIHLACAAQAETDLFLTNDKNLLGKIVPGIHFIGSLDTQLF